MTFKETLQPAIDYAEQGFPVSERIAVDWTLPSACGAGAGDAAPLLHAASTPTRWPPGTSTAEAVRRRARSSATPAWRSTFRLLQQQGRDAFYRGEIARAIVAKSTASAAR